MAPSKKNQDEIRRQKKECERRRREKIKSDPQLYEEAKAKERERYRRRKEEKKILPIHKMSERKQRKQRKEWHKRQKNCRENRKCRERLLARLRDDSPSSSDDEVRQPPDNIGQPTLDAGQPSRDFEQLFYDLRTQAPSVARTRSRSVASLQSASVSSRQSAFYRDSSPSLLANFSPSRLDKASVSSRQSTSYRDSSPSLLSNFSPSRLDSPSESSATSYQKKMGLKTMKHNRYNINKKLKLQEKMIATLKKKVNALRMKASREKVSTTFEQDRKKTRVKQLNTIGDKKIAVKNFFENDENTRLMAGKRDVITRNKVKKQKRLLNDSLGNLYKKFIGENPCKMSYATFCRLKPFWVLQASVVKRETCLCVIHENLSFIVEKLHFLRVLPCSSIDEVAKKVVCNVKSDPCVLRHCAVCKDRVPPINTFIDSPTTYRKWVVKKEKRNINGIEKMITRTVKDTIETTKVDLVKLLIEQIPKFLKHKQIITNQYEYINTLKKNLKVGELLLHMDFSENYQTKYSQEIQSVHFGASRQQLTLHTVVAYYRDLITDQIVTRSFCTLSESLRHDASAVYAHILPVIHQINELTPIHSLHFLSDAPSTQYRNKSMIYIFSNLLPKVFSLQKAEWSYSAPGHGKGAPDGVGGYTKRTADRIVSQGKDVSDMQTLFQVLSSQESNITYMLVQDSDIAHIDSMIPRDLKSIRGTMNAYQVLWSKNEENAIFLRRLSCATCDKDCEHYGIGKYFYTPSPTVINVDSFPSSSQDNRLEVPGDTEIATEEIFTSDRPQLPDETCDRELTVGRWAVIKYICKKTDVFYIGNIVTAMDSKYFIKFLRKKKCGDEYTEFIWPQCEDVSEVNEADIIITLPQPYCGRRSTFYFKNTSLSSFSNLR